MYLNSYKQILAVNLVNSSKLLEISVSLNIQYFVNPNTKL